LSPPQKTDSVKKDFLLARDILELATSYSMKIRDEKNFEKFVAQLKPFYFDFKDYLPASERMYSILGGWMLFLLSQGRLAEFHSEIEIIPDLQNQYINYSIELERDLMEGRYHKVWKSRTSVPSRDYVFFLDKLSETIRKEIADSMQIAYSRLAVNDAAKLLWFDTVRDFNEFAAQRQWNVEGDYVNFVKEREGDGKEIPALPLIESSLRYAQELERII